MITVQRFLITADTPKVKLLTANGLTDVLIRSTGTAVYVGDTNVSIVNGFRLGAEITSIHLKNNDELWAIATSTAIVSLLIQS